MVGDIDPPAGLLDDDEVFDLLQEMAANTPEEVRRRRAHFRISVKAAVILQPGNASDLLRFKVKGVTGDVSEGGLSAVFPIPVRVGDVYRLQFDREALDLPLTFARCVRCRLIREDAFKAGFSFFNRIALPEGTSVCKESDLT
jgi:c-di-GMP-binding flagellar brake protein YcgR